MDISIIIVSWNTSDLLAQCLASVFAYPPSGSFEVIVVDNGSADNSAQMVKSRFPQVRLIENTLNAGFARANNQAIHASIGGYIVLLNSDTLVKPSSLSVLGQFMRIHADAGIAGGKLLNADQSFQASYADFPTLKSELLSAAGLARWHYGRNFPSHASCESMQERTVDWVGGAYLMARREAILDTGLMDEGYFFSGEEMDWCYRMWQHAWKVYFTPHAEVVHLGGQSSKHVSTERLLWATRGHVRFFMKAHGQFAADLLILAIKSLGLCKTIFWLMIAMLPVSTHTLAKDKARSNWKLVTEHLYFQ